MPLGRSPTVQVTASVAPATAPRFLADAMRGGWPGGSGCSAWTPPTTPPCRIPDGELGAGRGADPVDSGPHAAGGTRTTAGTAAGPDAPLLRLREVVVAVGLAPSIELFTRCLVRNDGLRLASAAEIDTRIPPATRRLPEPVRGCPGCGRVYWPGSHARRMRPFYDNDVGSNVRFCGVSAQRVAGTV